MPSIQIDLPLDAEPDVKRELARQVGVIYASTMQINADLLTVSIHALGDAISPPLIGLLAGWSSLATAFLVVGIAILASGIVWLIGSKHLGRDTELANTRLAPDTPGRS